MNALLLRDIRVPFDAPEGEAQKGFGCLEGCQGVHGLLL